MTNYHSNDTDVFLVFLGGVALSSPTACESGRDRESGEVRARSRGPTAPMTRTAAAEQRQGTTTGRRVPVTGGRPG